MSDAAHAPEPPVRSGAPELPASFTAIRARLVDAVLVMASILGVPTLAISLYRITEIGWRPIMGLHIATLTVFATLAIAGRRVPYAIRAGAVGIGLAVLSVAALLTFGLAGFGLPILITAIVLITSLYGRAAGATLVGLGALVVCVIGVAVHGQAYTFDVDVVRYSARPTAWYGASLGLLLFGGAIVKGLDHIHRSLVRANEALAAEVAERRRAEAALCEQEATVRALVESSKDWIWVIDLEGRHTFSNPAVEAILGYRPEELVGRDGDALLHEDDRRAVQAAMPGWIARKHGWSNLTLRWRHRDGTWRTLESNAVPVVGADGVLAGFRGVDRDVTERRQLEERLRQGEKMRAIGTLAGGIAHDFNNLLHAVSGNADLALHYLERETPGPAIECVREITRAAARAGDLVRQIQSSTRQTPQEVRPVRLQSVVAEATTLLGRTLPSIIELQVELDPACGPVRADPSAIHQVVMNLCTNAFQAMLQGGVLRVSLSPLRLDPEQVASLPDLEAGDYARLLVEDTGHGMDGATLERIFEPYFTTRESQGGTGLGLATVHAITRALGGAITVHSAPGKGTRVEVFLPVSDDATDEIATEPRELPGGQEHVWLVDDEEANLFLGRRMLERLGYRVTTMASAEAAIQAFRGDPGGLDLLMSDLTMPRMTGMELARLMTTLRPELPVIIYTGHGEPPDPAVVRDAGVRAWLPKPLEPHRLADSLRAALGTTRTSLPEPSEDAPPV